MSGRRRQTLSPTLFPFLAVLVCTLGTLILLLALVAQNTNDAAEQIAEQAAEKASEMENHLTVGQVKELIEEEQFRLDELVSFRDAQTSDLEDRRNQLAHLDDHMRRIRERLQQIGDAMQRALSDQPMQTVSADEIAALRQRLIAEQRQVEKLRDEVSSERPRIVIVPHQGPNGTTRRPIYLECTRKGVTIWPEGVEISTWQLEHSSRDANPLDDALRAARYHAMQEYGDQVPPYPMLVVRPDGVDSYFAARAAMLDWDDQFGYELVPDEVALAYPKPDPEMRKRIEYAVAQAAKRVQAQAIVQRSYGRGTGRPGSAQTSGSPYASGAGSGVASADPSGSNSGGNMPRLSVSQMDREGRRSGYNDHRTLPLPTYGGGGSGSYGSDQPVTAEAAKRRLERQLEESASLLADGDGEQSLGQAAQQLLGQTGDQGSPDGRQQESEFDAANADSTSGSTAQDALAMAVGNSDQGWSRQANSQAAKPIDGAPAGVGPSAGVTPRTQAMNQPKTSQRPPAGAQAQSGSNQSTSSSSSDQQQPANNTKQMVRREGASWALPSHVAMAQGNDIVRSLNVEVYPDRFVLRPSAGGRAAQTFHVQPTGVESATVLMATEIRDRIDRWGAAIPGGRWSPRLQVHVMSGGEARYRQLGQLMNGSGIPIERAAYRQAGTAEPGAVQ
ncbi:hypothetical protein NHH03_01075 [Stieleria sp. TO1_6]|uniref:hypothetical protein n=1 Tax=Stieleria tagensis TaxID=2956795 RepID=UPI00209A7F8A|nr:hypothetical protein [Stieleria tagensis]MCO8120309.1 hypothetical protein [Stieleria tagensis]